VMTEGEVMGLADSFFEPLEGSQVFPKNRRPGRWQASGVVEAGIYSPRMEFLRPALRLHEITSPGELLVSSGIPRVGRPVAGGMTLLRVASTESAVDAASGELHPWMRDAVGRLYESLALRPVSEDP